MTLSAVGIFSAAGAGAGVGDYELIQTQVLGSNQALIAFSNLNNFSSTYRHLQLRIVVRSAVSEAASQVGLYLNGDTSSSNYAFHQLFGNGSSAGSEGYGTGVLGQITPIVRTFGATGTANAFGAGVVDILDPYSTTKNKTVRSLQGAAGVNAVGLTSGLWIDTAAVTSITLLKQGGGDLATGSRFSLYGIRG